MENKEVYALIIIGGSAAATSAGVYAARRGLNFKIITKEFGGEVATSGEIGNWPGVSKTDGITLAGQFKEHLKYYGVEPEEGIEVEKVLVEPDGSFLIKSNNGNYAAKTVIITTGVHPRELGVPGEKEFRNKGVSYCTVCDGPLFAGKVVATVGGGNSALESALMLSDIANKVYVINKNPAFKGDQILIDNLNKKNNVEVVYNAKTSQVGGGEFVTGLKYVDEAGQKKELSVEGIFVHIGMVPNSGLVPDEVAKDQFGQIKVNANCETNIPGLYAAGDVTDVPFKQIIIAAGQGTIALLSAISYLNRQK
ncbi:MAG TPA: FAD-dependent oxidoreductase [Candidatus Paceibacterota bacterium]